MGLRRFLATYVLPPPQLGGITARQWWRILRQNRFAVDPPYWLRALSLTGMSLATSLGGSVERLRFGRKIATVTPNPPLFVLGFWRSGTSHLHNLLATHPDFVAPTTYQALCPHTFLSSESIVPRLLWPLIEATRPMDNMRAGFDQPQEDEFALCAVTGLSHLMGFAFDRNHDRYEKYLTFDSLSADEHAEWREALRWFVQKILVNQADQTAVLKSPQHTGRIQHLLEVFPEARFVHIHRHPHAIYRSLVHTWRHLSRLLQFQRCDERQLENRIVERYRRVYDCFFAQRSMIPEHRFFELGYGQLTQQPIPMMSALNRHFEWGAFRSWEPGLRRYLDSLAGYRPNALPPLPARVEERLAAEWAPTFDAWNYSPRDE